MTPAGRKRVRRLLWPKQGGKCCYCGAQLVKNATGRNPLRVTIEHLRRKCDGGTDQIDNLALSCHECNAGRGLTDWLSYKTYRSGEVFA